MFYASKGEYEQALRRCGSSNISLSFQQPSTSHVKQQRHRKIIWFNQPFSLVTLFRVRFFLSVGYLMVANLTQLGILVHC